MKKVLLTLSALATLSAQAQQRLSLYEEFSGENCGPCAAANPGLWSLLSGGTNPSKVLLIKYQSPIPSAGPIYLQWTADFQNRSPYYSVPFAPYGRLNGTNLGTGTAAPSSPGHVANLTQTDINNAAAVTAPFNITVTHAWNATGDSVTATINVTTPAAYAPAGANLKMRVALIEHLVFETAPGTNGETDFHNVVRRMYPDGNGTAISNSWTMGQTQTYTIKGYAPPYVNKNGADTRIVVFIQNDADKSISQAAVSTAVPVPLDVATDAMSIPSRLVCTGSSANVAPTVTLKNTGSTAVTSATIYYRVDNGAWQSHPWTGNLATNATATVTLPGIAVTPGVHTISDSVAMPNGAMDINFANNVKTKPILVQNTTPNNLPYSTDFENAGQMPTNYMLYDMDDDNQNWRLVKGSTSNIGHNNSVYTLYHPNYAYPAGEINMAIIPTPNMPAGNKSLDFWYAYATYQTEQDRLDIVYSTDCGQNWTTVWSQQGTALQTAPATTANFVPTQTQWKYQSVDMSGVPTGAMIGFRAISAYGNNLFVDDIRMRTGTTGVEEVVASGLARVYPNPAKDKATIEFTMSEQSKVSIQIIDAAGRVVNNVLDQNLAAGVHKVDVNTSAMAAGLYNVKIQTEKGNLIERLTVAK